jgi:hypothetical protein
MATATKSPATEKAGEHDAIVEAAANVDAEVNAEVAAEKEQTKETDQQKKNRLRNEAEREVLNAHRSELNAITERKFKENNLVYTRRLTDTEKAARTIEELLDRYPELREQYEIQQAEAASAAEAVEK